MVRSACAVALAALLASRAPAQQAEQPTAPTFDFPQAGVTLSGGFCGARISECLQLSESDYAVVVEPENTPINDSAWYAFQISARSSRMLTVRLRYRFGTHRYAPKISRDGKQWQPLPPATVQTDRRGVSMRLRVGPEPTWVAGQELLSVKQTADWIARLAELPHVESSPIGQSVQGRPIERLEIAAPGAPPDYVFVLGRQHPPEISGAIGMMHFVEALAAPTPLAAQFRRRYRVVVVPLINPDGVQHGHWRHNARGVDLNRDWGPFSQPETRAVRDQMLRCTGSEQGRLMLALDFHSTYHDVFYTHTDSAPIARADFTRTWLASLQSRLPDYQVRRDARHGEDRPTSRNWITAALGVPAITYEFGDETDRDLIRTVAVASAEEMMKQLLRHNSDGQSALATVRLAEPAGETAE